MQQIELNFIKKICEDMEKLNGTNFEYFSRNILFMILGQEINHKGHNLYAKPVKSTADFNTNNFEVIGQCGTDNEYFKFPVKVTTQTDIKPIKDINSAIKNHPQSEVMYLFANQLGTGGALSKLNIEIGKKRYSQTVEVYDSEKTANVILKNILNSKTKMILQRYLPTAYEFYKLLPQTNIIPNFTSKKYFKRDVEKNIIDILLKKRILQVYGISGLGKTELIKNIAYTLLKDFESVIWISGENQSNIDFESIYNSKFNSDFSLKILLKNHKIILLLDNFNDNLNEFKKNFEKYNNNNSVCLITSLQMNLIKNSYKLEFLSEEISKKILFETKNQPSDEIANEIIKYIKGYPLLLNIIRDSVEDEEETWEDVLDDLKDAVKIDDPEKNKKISMRILEKQLPSIEEPLKWIYLLNSKFISKEFLEFCITRPEVKSLIKKSIISETESSSYTVHQIILDSITDILKNNTTIDKSYDKVNEFLEIQNEKKSVGYFNFLSRHDDFINKVYNSLDQSNEIKKQILHSKVQATYGNNDYFLEEIEKFDLNYNSKINILLLIEKIELELYMKKNNEDFCKEKIKLLENLLFSCEVKDIDKYLNHHIGKLYIKIRERDVALKYFYKVLEKDKDADYTKLQVARILSWDKENDNFNKLDEIFFEMLTKPKKWKDDSLSVLLSMYDVLSKNDMFVFREKYIYADIDNFIEHLFYSLNFGFEQPLQLLANLSRNLQYDQKNKFIEICESLPEFIDTTNSFNIKYAYATIQVAYYKALKSSNCTDKKKLDKLLDNAELNYKSIELSDYERSDFVNLYIYSDKFEKALDELEKYNNKNNAFYFQKLCQVYRGLAKFDESLSAIKESLCKDKYYKSDFLNDQAKTLFSKGEKAKACVVLKEAIQIQLNPKIKDSWNIKLIKWKNS